VAWSYDQVLNAWNAEPSIGLEQDTRFFPESIGKFEVSKPGSPTLCSVWWLLDFTSCSSQRLDWRSPCPSDDPT